MWRRICIWWPSRHLIWWAILSNISFLRREIRKKKIKNKKKKKTANKSNIESNERDRDRVINRDRAKKIKREGNTTNKQEHPKWVELRNSVQLHIISSEWNKQIECETNDCWLKISSVNSCHVNTCALSLFPSPSVPAYYLIEMHRALAIQTKESKSPFGYEHISSHFHLTVSLTRSLICFAYETQNRIVVNLYHTMTNIKTMKQPNSQNKNNKFKSWISISYIFDARYLEIEFSPSVHTIQTTHTIYNWLCAAISKSNTISFS